MRSEAEGFGPSELTLLARWRQRSSLPTSPFLDSFRIAVHRIPDLAESRRWTIQQGQGGNDLRSQPRHCSAEETLPSDGQCNAAPCYSLNATPLNAATPGALDVATWVKSP
jgi:hypothetical protein